MFLPSNITLQFGDSGDFVSELQCRLAMAKCFSEDMVNGFYDGNTVNGVTRFQAMVGLHADGVAGPETLRRLNGMISGSSSANTDKKEEEEKARAGTQEAMQVFFGNQPQQPDPGIWGGTSRPPEPQQSAPTPEMPAVQPSIAPEQQNKPNEFQSQTARQDPTLAPLYQQQQHHQQPPHVPADALAQQMVNQQRPGDSLIGGQDKAQLPEKQEPKTMLGRAVKFASEYLQKLADYFESKLPPSVLSEVREIGQVMAKSGLRETPIPMGPELAPKTPARGPEQQAPTQQQRI